MPSRCRRFVSCLLLVSGLQLQAANPPRYLAKTGGGQIVEGDQLENAGSRLETLTLDGQPLLAGDAPIRWLIDREAPPRQAPQSFIEFVGGDRIPGTVTAYHPASEGYGLDPAHLVLRSNQVRLDPAAPSGSECRVGWEHVRRIVWQPRRIDRYQPARIFLRNGGTLAFRSLRPQPRSVRVLLEDGPRTVEFEEIAELHLPAADDWQHYFATVSVLCSGPQSCCYAVTTVDGAQLTASQERFQIAAAGRQNAVPLEGLQPVWSLDMLWLQRERIHSRRFWQPASMPLTWAHPAVSERPPFGRAPLWPWRSNTTVAGAPLMTQASRFGWGLGCQGTVRFEFPLPPAAERVVVSAALDRPTHPVQVAAELSWNGGPLGEPQTLSSTRPVAQFSAPLRPSSADSGRLALISRPLPPETGQAAAAGIQSSMHWGDPRIECDVAAVTERLAKQASQQVTAWRGWQVAGLPSRRNTYAATADRQRYFTAFYAQDDLLLSRRGRLPEEAAWLVVDATRSDSGGAPELEIAVGDDRQRFPVKSVRGAVDRQPICLPLKSVSAQQPVTIEIRQLEETAMSAVIWHSIRFAPQHPSLYRIFEDARPSEAGPPPVAEDAVAEDAFAGDNSLIVDSDTPAVIPLAAPVPIRERPLPGEYRYLRFAFREQTAGGLRLTLGAADGSRDAHYLIGAGKLDGRVKPIADGTADRWLVVTRDIFADFGPIDLIAFNAAVPQAGHYLVDHCYLARTLADFDLAARDE